MGRAGEIRDFLRIGVGRADHGEIVTEATNLLQRGEQSSRDGLQSRRVTKGTEGLQGGSSAHTGVLRATRA